MLSAAFVGDCLSTDHSDVGSAGEYASHRRGKLNYRRRRHLPPYVLCAAFVLEWSLPPHGTLISLLSCWCATVGNSSTDMEEPVGMLQFTWEVAFDSGVDAPTSNATFDAVDTVLTPTVALYGNQPGQSAAWHWI